MNQKTPPKIRSLAAAKQRRLDDLLEKNSNGEITPKERARLNALVAESEQLMVENSQRLADFARSQSPGPPATAIPVTVWVTPQPAEQ